MIMPWLINAAQLDKFRKNQKSVIILDASWHLPHSERNAKQEFLAKHIINAHFFDLNEFHDQNNPVPNMLIHDEKIISEKLCALGIRDDYKIIFYDNSDLHTSCRALWMLKIFGHNPHQLYILDGGLAAWEKYGGKIESGETHVTPKQYTAHFHPEFLRSLAEMKKNLHRPTQQVIDLRHSVRYAGGPEPRAGIRRGHIPGSYCFPYTSFYSKEGNLLPPEKIRRLLADIGIDLATPIISTCGSGMTASILNFVLDLLGHSEHALYDGSWTEWGAENLYPDEKSLEERPVVSSLD
jgi:thiosulfate/3-mercaptopyruvate sulfurtransferase